MRVEHYAPKPQPDIQVVKFDASLGWDHALRLARWCGGEARRDTQEGQQEKTYYWSITFPDCRAEMYEVIVPGDYIAYDGQGFFLLGDEDIEQDYIKKENA